MTRFLLLTSDAENGEVVKQVDTCFYGFRNGEWKRRGISAGYFLPGSPEYEQYRVIKESEANEILKMPA